MNRLIIWSTIVTLCRGGGDWEGYCMGLSLNFPTFGVYIKGCRHWYFKTITELGLQLGWTKYRPNFKFIYFFLDILIMGQKSGR